MNIGQDSGRLASNAMAVPLSARGKGFPTRADEDRMQAFHDANWTARAEITDTMEDDRWRELGHRLIFENAPTALDKARNGQLEVWLQNRRTGKDGVETGRTLAAARNEIDKLLSEKGESRELKTIEEWLQNCSKKYSEDPWWLIKGRYYNTVITK